MPPEKKKRRKKSKQDTSGSEQQINMASSGFQANTSVNSNVASPVSQTLCYPNTQTSYSAVPQQYYQPPQDKTLQQFQHNEIYGGQLGIHAKLDLVTKQLETMFLKLNKLDIIESRLGNLESSIQSVNTDISKLKSNVLEIEGSMQFMNEKFEQAMKDNVELHKTMKETYQQSKDIENCTKTLENEVSEMREQYLDLKERHLDLQTRSMRDNLVFTGIAENGPEENTEKILTQFIKTEMEIDHTISFHRVHRFGRKNYSGPRPIVAKFSNFKEREIVRKAAPSKLKGKMFGVNEQFPKEINDRRKVLYPYYKQAKRAGKRATLVYDRLYIDGTLFKKDTRHTAHEQMDATTGPEQQTREQTRKRSTPPRNSNNSSQRDNKSPSRDRR